MKKLGRAMYAFQVPFAILLPTWIGIGRTFFGAGGWLMLITVFITAPLLFMWLIALAIINHFRTDVRSAKAFPPLDAKLMFAASVGTVLCGFFLVDGGDTNDSIGSAFSMLIGHHLLGLSAIVAVVSGVTAFAALVAASIVAVMRLVRHHRWQPAA